MAHLNKSRDYYIKFSRKCDLRILVQTDQAAFIRRCVKSLNRVWEHNKKRTFVEQVEQSLFVIHWISNALFIKV